MHQRAERLSRRKFLASAAAAALGSGLPSPASTSTRPQPTTGRKPIAAICTVYRPLSDAYHILGRFLHGYTREGTLQVPGYQVASLHVDQRPETDLSRDISREFGVRLCPTVAEALTDERGRLAVNGILLIAEHGNYPRNDKDQVLYPRYEMLEQIVQVFQQTGQSVPVFMDRHLSHDWPKAQQMAGWARELGFPLMAGSSLPATWRRPELQPPAGITEALVAGYGPIEAYGFQALEALQVMLERDSGVKSVTCLTGKDVWRAGDEGRWGRDLLEAALSRSETVNLGDIRRNVGSMPVGTMPRIPATAFLIEFHDGLRGTVLLLNGHVQDFTVALRIRGESRPASCLFHMPGLPGARHFDCLAAAIEQMFETRHSPYPLDRALLTTGLLAAAMESHHRRGQRIETPELDRPAVNSAGK